MGRIIRWLWVWLIFPAAVLSSCSPKPVMGVIITGQNNHNWPVSHQAIKQTLENSGRFKMDVAVSPEAGGDMSGFHVDFDKYRLVVLDSSDLEDTASTQQITCNTNSASVASSRASLRTAELSLEDYIEGTFEQEWMTIENEIDTAREEQTKEADSVTVKL